MAILSWGKPRIIIKDSAGKYTEMDTPVDGSTTLSTTQGDKTEAKIEGGANEAVRYDSDNYQLALQIRAAKDREKPLTDKNGIIDGEFEVFLQPEDKTAPGFRMAKTTAHCGNGWSAADGGTWDYTFDALSESGSDNLLEWGTVTITESGGIISSVAIS